MSTRLIPRGLAVALSSCLAASLIGCVESDPDESCIDCPGSPDAMPEGIDGGVMPDAAPDAEPGEPACRVDFPPVDLLFVIDDSGSMCEEQGALADAFADLYAAFGDVDWRMAVTTTDMSPDNRDRGAFDIDPALPVPSLNCLDTNGEPDVPDTADCQDLIGETILDSQVHGEAELARRFRCMITVGTQGDGFEKPLAAADRALDCAGPNAGLLGPCGVDAVFLRPGAALAVVYVGDEDDCSDAQPAPGEELEECNGDGGRCALPRTANNACAWYADELTPVGQFVDRLRAANPAAAGVTALTLAGPRFAPIDGNPVRFVPGSRDAMCEDEPVSAACCPDGECPGDVAPVCEGAFGSAFAGDRLRAMAEAFPGEGEAPSICDAGGPQTLALRIVQKIEASLPPLCDPE